MDNKETIVKFLEEMSTQDNRATAFPIFYVIRDPGCNDSQDEDVGDRRPCLEHGMFLTESDAHGYLRDNSHNYSKRAYVYVKCAQRSPKLREFLLALFSYFGIPPRKDPWTM